LSLFCSWVIFTVFLFGNLFPCENLAAKQDDSEGIPVLAIGPSFLRPPVYRFLYGSKRTILYPALLDKQGELKPLDGKAFRQPEDWDRLIRDAQERASLQLVTLDPEMIRDAHGVIQMAVVTSKTPATASFILSPEFLDHFSAIFGPEILISLPTQNKICIFPRLANHLAEMSGAIRDEYLLSSIPASTEIFELSSKGIRAVGSIDPDDDN